VSVESAPRFVVGIDLGTTNSAVACVDAARADWRVEDVPVPQLVGPGRVEPRETLPSFHYEPVAGELPAGALRLAWDAEDPRHAVGVFARDHGAAVPGRLIASAKSWLSHAGVDRSAGLLPWHGAPDVARLSPVEVSARYLTHLRRAWDHRHPAHPLAAQDVMLTVPASFDEVARELTVEAATRAGLPRVHLLEEPQAAFYDWIHRQGEQWAERVAAGQRVLVCDVGGGTTDLTLIEVHPAGAGGLQFRRVAVGEHLILGGDNLDLALAHDVERRLGLAGELAPHDWGLLVRRAREAKERLLGDAAPARLAVNVAGGGTRLVGGSRQVELDRGEATALLVDGFLPRVALDARPDTRRAGFQEFGLPYAPDPAITRYLAAFLDAHLGAASPGPDLVLLNGGFFAAPALSRRLLEVLHGWFGPGRPELLVNDRLDLAVARGAAYYGMVRRGHGVRISGGLAQAYYVGVGRRETPVPTAVCLLPAGTEEGEETELARTFTLLIRQPVEFPLYLSSTRTGDRGGDLVAADPRELTPLPPIRTVLQSGKKTAAAAVPVRLHARRTEIGTLELWCGEVRGERRWRLQFDARGTPRGAPATATEGGEAEGIVDEAVRARAAEAIQETFRPGPALGAGAPEPPQALVKRLEAVTELGRHEWPPTLLRAFWEVLREVADGRRRSPLHEARWLNLLGFALRPGFGVALDDWRVAQTWRLFANGVAHPRNELCRAEWWILWRRLAGGLTGGQQQTLAEPLLATVQTPGARAPHERSEIWRLLGALELLPLAAKIDLGGRALDLAAQSREPVLRGAALWALGRLGGRVPVSGPLNALVPPETVETWVDRLMERAPADPGLAFAVVQLARRTGDRYRDLPTRLREAVAAWLDARGAAARYLALIRDGGTLRADEQRLVFGDALPPGLRIE
jgi:molecular chaperone DnaK (HSP70)